MTTAQAEITVVTFGTMHYRALHANRGTPKRPRKYNRVERNRQCNWSDGNRGGTILKRLFR